MEGDITEITVMYPLLKTLWSPRRAGYHKLTALAVGLFV